MKTKRSLILVLVATLLVLASATVMASEQGFVGAMNELSVDLATPLFYNMALSNGYAVPIYLNYQRVLMNHLVLSITPGFLYLYDNWSGARYVVSFWAELDWHPSRTVCKDSSSDLRSSAPIQTICSLPTKAVRAP